MMKRIAAAAVLIASATQAQAQPAFSFTPGGSSPASGMAVIYDFDTTAPSGILGPNVIIQSGTNSAGAAPASANPGGKYLSVLGGGAATISFSQPASAFSFDWGSADSYNVLTIFGSFGSKRFTGMDFAPPANGAQSGSATNGLFSALGNGDTFSGFKLESGSNSFEIDNVAVRAAVPEPATWAMMIGGFGLVGGAMRRRRDQMSARFA